MLQLNSVNELMEKVFPEQSWVIKDLVPSNGLVLFSAAPGQYKTWMVLDMAIKVATGQKLFNMYQTKQTGVLIVDEESGEPMLHDRLKTLGISKDANERKEFLINCQVNVKREELRLQGIKGKDLYNMVENYEQELRQKYETEEPILPIYYTTRIHRKMVADFRKELIEVCKEKKIGFIIFDSLTRFHNKDENASSQISEVMDEFKMIADEGIGCLLIHHNKKRGKQDNDTPTGESARGSCDIIASCDIHMTVNKDSSGISLSQTKNRYRREIKPIILSFVSNKDKICHFEYKGEKMSKKDWNEVKRKELFEYVRDNPGLNKSQLQDKFCATDPKLGRTKVGYMIEGLLKEGMLIANRGSHNSTLLYATDFMKTENMPEAPESF